MDDSLAGKDKPEAQGSRRPIWNSPLLPVLLSSCSLEEPPALRFGRAPQEVTFKQRFPSVRFKGSPWMAFRSGQRVREVPGPLDLQRKGSTMELVLPAAFPRTWEYFCPCPHRTPVLDLYHQSGKRHGLWKRSFDRPVLWVTPSPDH